LQLTTTITTTLLGNVTTMWLSTYNHTCFPMHAHTQRRIDRQVTRFKEHVHSCSLHLNHKLIHVYSMLVYVALSDHVSLSPDMWLDKRT